MSSNTENQRVNFASIKNPMKYPDFLEVQLKSFQDFLQLDTPPENVRMTGCTRYLLKTSLSLTLVITLSLNSWTITLTRLTIQ